MSIVLLFYTNINRTCFIFVKEKEFCGEFLLISDFVLTSVLLLEFEIRDLGAKALLENGFNLLINLACLVELNGAICIKIFMEILMLFHNFDFTLVILFNNLDCSFLEFDILDGLLLLSHIFDPLSCIVLLQVNLFAHLNILCEEADHYENK